MSGRERLSVVKWETYIDQILFCLELADNDLLQILQARHANVQPARDSLVRVVREKSVENFGQNINNLVASIENSQRSAANLLRETNDFLEAVAEGQIAQVVGSYEAARGGARNAIHAILGNVFVPTIDDSEIVAALISVSVVNLFDSFVHFFFRSL